MPSFTYKDLDAWKQAMDLVERCYRMTSGFPASELYGITSQMRRAAVSIPSNLAEGHCSGSTRVFKRHVSIALGSHGELETCIEISYRLGFISESQKKPILALSDSTGRLLNGLQRALKRKLTSHDRPPISSP